MDPRPTSAASGDEDAARLTVRLLGPWETQRQGEPLPRLRSRKGEWLLALLLLRNGGAVERDWLAGLLWPESAGEQARFNLRRNLTDLRHALGPEAERLQTPSPRTLRLDPAGADVDLLQFDAAIAQGGGAEQGALAPIDAAVRAALQRAVRLYRGPLLVECPEAWILPERTAREQAYLGALETLARDARARGDLEEAVRCLRRTVAVDPLRESAQYALMETLAAQGDALAGTLVFREYSLLLHRELNSAPGPEISALFQQLRARTRTHCRQTVSARRRSGAPTEPAGGLPPLHRAPLAALPSRLPRPVSSFIGREGEVAEIAAALAAARLVTLTGAGGVGKTRLAIRVGEQLGRDDPGGLAFVELATLSAPARAPTDDGQADPARVAAAAAGVLGVSEQPGRAITDTLRDFLRPRRLLLILDNCEHLIPECAALAATLLEECPALRLLATSRQSLGITGEVLWRVPPLSVPPGEGVGCRVWGVAENEPAPYTLHPTPYTLTQFESVRLFVERGRAVNREFALTAENAAAVAAICRRLDGLPLAIELAAARLRVLSVEQIATRLSDRFGLLTGGSRAALPRHQTLRATLEWSHDLLAEEERALFRRLAVFPGSFTLEAVAALQGLGGEGSGGAPPRSGGRGQGSGPDHPESSRTPDHDHRSAAVPPLTPEAQRLTPAVLDLLSGLVDKSLVIAEQGRYRLLETLREFAGSQQSEEEREAVGRRHALYYLSMAEPAARPTAETERLDRLDREHDNLRAAVDWAVRQREVEIAVRLGAALGGFWNARGYWREGRERLAAIVALESAGDLPPRVLVERAHALDRAGDLARLQNDDRLARELYEQALAIYRQIGDQHGIAWAGISLGDLARRREEFAPARSLITEALTFFQGLGDLPGILRALEHLGELAEDEGDRPAARQIYRQCLIMARELGDHWGIDYMLHSLGRLAYLDGDWATAKVRFTESLATARQSTSRQGAAFALYMLGSLARLEQDAAAAAAYHHESLALYRALEDAPSVAGSLAALAYTLLLQGDQDQAAALFKEALQINRKLENRRQTAHCLEGLAGVAALQGSGVRGQGSAVPDLTPDPHPLTPRLLSAARLYGAAAALREGDAPRWPADQADYERNLAALRARLDAASLAAAWEEGAALSLEEAIALALSVG